MIVTVGKTIKCLSLWQPWASLVIDGRKKIETRSWRAPAWLVGELIAIHATKGNYDADFGQECGYDIDIPRGAVLGIAKLTKCAQFDEAFYDAVSLTEEGRFGDFYPGRYGWWLEVVEKFSTPIPQKGAQGLFDWRRAARGAEEKR